MRLAGGNYSSQIVRYPVTHGAAETRRESAARESSDDRGKRFVSIDRSWSSCDPQPKTQNRLRRSVVWSRGSEIEPFVHTTPRPVSQGFRKGFQINARNSGGRDRLREHAPGDTEITLA
jgi:hypothetical protein